MGRPGARLRPADDLPALVDAGGDAVAIPGRIDLSHGAALPHKDSSPGVEYDLAAAVDRRRAGNPEVLHDAAGPEERVRPAHADDLRRVIDLQRLALCLSLERAEVLHRPTRPQESMLVLAVRVVVAPANDQVAGVHVEPEALSTSQGAEVGHRTGAPQEGMKRARRVGDPRDATGFADRLGDVTTPTAAPRRVEIAQDAIVPDEGADIFKGREKALPTDYLTAPS